MRILGILILIISCHFCWAQQELTGRWKGKITHEDGGYTPEYGLELHLILNGDSIRGRSHVYVDSIFASMNITGHLHSGFYLELKDEQILDHEELHGMEWCMKRYQLFLKQKDSTFYLEGHWQGETSFSKCVPGRIFLEKKEPRA